MFIELTDGLDGGKVAFNKKHISRVVSAGDKSIVYTMDRRSQMLVKESYEEIMKLIK